MRGVAILLMIGVVGCLRPDLVDCGDGRQCAHGQVCDLVHASCVQPDQVTACAGAPELAECSWSNGTGKCFGGICLAAGCGNGIVEPQEMCDDGNQTSGDGCNADCTSTEVCGNGFIDVALGEQCDDGSLASRDGCDSRCQLEAATWDVIGVEPIASFPNASAFDEVRGEMVHVTDGLTWTWNGSGWHLAAISGAPASAFVVWDSDRKTVVALSTSSPILSTFDVVSEWNGTSWSTRSAVGGPPPRSGLVTYDPKGQRLLVLASNTMWALDAAGKWASSVAPMSSALAMAFDAGAGVVVVAQDTSTTWELNGAIWTSHAAALPIDSTTMTFDGRRGAVVVVGGAKSGPACPTYSAKVYAWKSGAWADTAGDLPAARSNLDVVYDSVRQRLVASGGSDGCMMTVRSYDDVVEWDGQKWLPIDRGVPPHRDVAFSTLDSRRGELIVVQGTSQLQDTWTWDGAWHLTGAAPPTVSWSGNFTRMGFAYDPIRDAAVLVEGMKTWEWAQGAWSNVGAGLNSIQVMAFDPHARRMVAIALGTWTLPSDGPIAWTRLTSMTPPANGGTPSLAFDARNNVVVETEEVDGANAELIGTTWTPTLSTNGVGYAGVANQRRGTVEFIGGDAVVWERSGSTWNELDHPPVAITGVPQYDPVAGRVVIYGIVGNRSAVIVTRTLTSSLPTETCAPGVDADGDGLTGCDDPDCWWICRPVCPPYATCP